jgi:DNA-directed RNA polymerase specialized sigma24 family protein
MDYQSLTMVRAAAGNSNNGKLCMDTIAQRITPHVPLLRRFARALYGNQRQGDENVAATLESLIVSPESFPEAKNPRAALYKSFLQTVSASDASEAVDEDGAAARALQGLSRGPRLAFLLTAVEGFTADETAFVLSTDVAGVLQLIEQADQQIARQMATDVLIIEDEPLVAMDLESIVSSLGHRVSGVARTHKEAIAAVEKHRPGLVLADIQLADGSSGLQAVNEILQSDELPVIFITAFPERLLTGARPEPAFLITKPFRIDAVKAIISQVLFFDARARKVGTQVR